MSTPLRLEHLRVKAKSAHDRLTWDSEEKADSIIIQYSGELDYDLEQIPETLKERYILSYTTRLSDWLTSISKTANSHIVGPARFDIEKTKKLKDRADSRFNDWRDWRKKELKDISKQIDKEKSSQQKSEERFEKVKIVFLRLATRVINEEGNPDFKPRMFTNAITKTIQSFVQEGEVDIVRKSLDFVSELNKMGNKPIIGENDSIWALIPVAERVHAEKMLVQAEVKVNAEQTINEIRIVHNYETHRVQIFFPDEEHAVPYRKALKASGWHWTPSLNAYQRKLTNAAIYDATRIASMAV